MSNQEAMLADVRVLRPEFVPAELQHRDREQSVLTSSLEPLIDGQDADPLILTGPTGVGKTCLTRHTLSRLTEEAIDLDTVEVNCWEDHSPWRCLYRILEEVGQTADLHRQSTPQDELVERLRAYEGDCVVVLDEVDQLDAKGLIYDLRRLPQFTLVLICNREEDLYAEIDDRLQSRLHGTQTIHFDAYSVSELVGILRARANAALAHPDAVSDNTLEEIADAAAGDARVAISVLREAAKAADRNERDEITTKDVTAAIPRGRETVREKARESLKPTQETLYAIIREYVETNEEAMPPGDLYDEYQAAVDDPVGDRQVRRHLSKLEHYNLVAIKGSTRDRRYGLHDQ